MKIFTFDTENTTHLKGNPFSRCNKCCVISYKVNADPTVVIKWEYDEPITGAKLALIQRLIDKCDLIVGFNLKYDLHWLKRYGIKFDHKRLFCCQVTQFVIRNQQERYPSLDSSCEFWSLGKKLDIIEREYWDKGINTDQIPWEPLSEYARQDVDLTYSLYLKQEEYLRNNPQKRTLISLLQQDLLVLQEMEWNGLIFDTTEANKRVEILTKELDSIYAAIKGTIGQHPINFNSPDHVSAILYGGTIEFVDKQPYEHTYKSGKKAGLTEVRYHHIKHSITFPELVKPLEKSELAKGKVWSTSADTLVRLKAKGAARTIIKGLLRIAELEQLRSMYYVGWPEKIKEADWPENEVHSQLNQCVAITGRLSSSGPNQQNVPGAVYELIETRFT